MQVGQLGRAEGGARSFVGANAARSTCKWVNSDARKEGSKYCVLTHLEDNGVAAPPEIPLATGATHVTTEFEGTKEGYPVLFGSFVGGHTDNARNPGSDVNWIAKETWDFFMQF